MSGDGATDEEIRHAAEVHGFTLWECDTCHDEESEGCPTCAGAGVLISFEDPRECGPSCSLLRVAATPGGALTAAELQAARPHAVRYPWRQPS